MDLFDEINPEKNGPLSERMRPHHLDEVVASPFDRRREDPAEVD